MYKQSVISAIDKLFVLKLQIWICHISSLRHAREILSRRHRREILIHRAKYIHRISHCDQGFKFKQYLYLTAVSSRQFSIQMRLKDLSPHIKRAQSCEKLQAEHEIFNRNVDASKPEVLSIGFKCVKLNYCRPTTDVQNQRLYIGPPMITV